MELATISHIQGDVDELKSLIRVHVTWLVHLRVRAKIVADDGENFFRAAVVKEPGKGSR